MKTLKDRLIHAREIRSLTQAELAKKSKCAQSAIGNVESGQRDSLRNIVLVARALNVSADWLYDGKGPEPTKITPHNYWDAQQANPNPFLGACEANAKEARGNNYDPYTYEVILLMNRLDLSQKAAALARLKEFTGHLAPQTTAKLYLWPGKKIGAPREPQNI